MAAAPFIVPMQALGCERPPTGHWQCEMKFDGYRVIATLNEGRVQLWSRTHKSLSEDFPEVVQALSRLKCRHATLDGEVVALDGQGHSRFQLLQRRGQPGARPDLVYYLFDLIHRDGKSLVNAPLEVRRKQLEAVVGKAKTTLQLSPLFYVEPTELFAAARQQGLEGIIAKRPGSRYETDRRSGAWIKCKVVAEQEFVIGGFSPPRNSRPYFGALLVGHYQAGKLVYAGKVGTGFNHKRLRSLHEQFGPRISETCPFHNLPLQRKPRFGEGLTRAAMKQMTWLKPELVAQVKFAEWTNEGLLRQPVFLGLRQDKRAKDVHREASAA